MRVRGFDTVGVPGIWLGLAATADVLIIGPLHLYACINPEESSCIFGQIVTVLLVATWITCSVYVEGNPGLHEMRYFGILEDSACIACINTMNTL